MCVSAACLREGLRHIRQTNVSCLLVRLSLFSTIYFLFFLMLLFTFLHSPFFPPAFLFPIPLFPSTLLHFTLLYFLCTLRATQSLVLARTVLLSLVSFFSFSFIAKLLLSLSFALAMCLLLLRTSQSPHATAKFGDLSFSH